MGQPRGSGLSGAIRFLTRIPVPGPGADAGSIARSVAWFPVVGAGIGALVGAVYAVGLLIWPAPLASTTAIAVGLAVTGAFHEDGLADTADAFGAAAAHRSPAEVLRIMRDPTLGSYGVLALTVTFVARVTALSVLDTAAGFAALVGAHSVGRGAAVGAMRVATAAPDGLGAEHARRVARRDIRLAVAAAVAVAIVAMGVWGVAAVAVAVLTAVVVTRWARRAVGGITGDILGAVEQIAELAVLVGAATIAHNGWAELAWWWGR